MKAEGAGREAVTDQAADDREESVAGAVEVVSRPALNSSRRTPALSQRRRTVFEVGVAFPVQEASQ